MSQTPERYPITFLVGMALGMALGAILALWYAPQSGNQTRQQIGLWVNQGESIEQALAEGRALAHEHRASQAKLV